MKLIISKMRNMKTPKQKLYRVFLKLLALQLLIAGILQWALIVQLLQWQGKYYTEMPIDWQVAIVYHAIVDLVAGVGIWMNTPWGMVVWIAGILMQFVIHTVLTESFGASPVELSFYILSVIVFFILRHHAESERKFTMRQGSGLLQHMPERRRIWRK